MSSTHLCSCLSQVVYFKDAFVSGKKGTQSPYGLSQNVLQTLLRASVGAFTQSLSHQETLVVLKKVGMGFQGGKILHSEKLDAEMLRGKCAEPRILMICVFSRHMNS